MPEHYIRKARAYWQAAYEARIHKANETKGAMVSIDVSDLLPM